MLLPLQYFNNRFNLKFRPEFTLYPLPSTLYNSMYGHRGLLLLQEILKCMGIVECYNYGLQCFNNLFNLQCTCIEFSL